MALATTQADADLWGHVLFGRDIWRNAAIPRVDPYSFTSDLPWVNHEWLAEVLMFSAYSAGGGLGLSLLRLLLIAATVLVIVTRLRGQSVDALSVDLLLVSVVVTLVPQTATIRPQNFSIVFFTALLVSLDRRSREKRIDWRFALWSTALMALWVNTHGGWVVGAGTLVVWALASMVAGAAPLRDRGIAAVCTVVPISGVLLNPYGMEMLQFIWHTVGFRRGDILEWQGVWSSAASGPLVIWVCISLFTGWAIWRMRGELDVPSLCVVMTFAFASFRVRRLLGFFAISTIVLLGVHLVNRAARGSAPRKLEDTRMPLLLWLGVLSASGLLMAYAVDGARCVRIEGPWRPDGRAARFIAGARLQGRLLSWFDWGQYAIWHFSPNLLVSMDGRRETVYSETTRERHNDAYAGRPAGLDYALSLGADYAWLPVDLPLNNRLQRSRWIVLFASERSVVLASPTAPRPLVPVSVPSNADAPRCFPGP